MERHTTFIVKMSTFPILGLMICKFNVNPIKIPARFFMDKEKFTLKFIQKGTDSRIVKTILTKKNWAILNGSTQYSGILLIHSYNNRYCVTLAEEQTQRSMEKKREPRNKPTQVQTTDFWHSCKSNSMTNGVGATGYPQARKWTSP